MNVVEKFNIVNDNSITKIVLFNAIIRNWNKYPTTA